MMITSFLYNSTTFNPSMPVVPIQVRHQNRTAEVIALIDSGADATILPINILHHVVILDGPAGVTEIRL
jgi:hypothetical protein